jgi:raffinose/stachyose/melibiose transport system substrate-binding protein
MDLTRRSLLSGAAKLTAGAAAASALAACGSSSSGGSGSGSGSGTTTLTLWYDHPEWQTQFNKLVSQFEKENPGISIQASPKPGAPYNTIIASALATGSAPDIFKIDAGAGFVAAVNGGHFHDLTGKLNNIGNYNDGALAVSQVNGKLYGISILGQYNIGIYYWLDEFAKYNLHPPTTWDEWTAVCSTLKKNGVVPFLNPASDGILTTFLWTTLLTTVQGPEAVPKIESGTVKITEPSFLAATEFYKSMEPYFNPGYLSIGINTGDSLFAYKKAAMICGGSADYAGFQSTNPAVTGNLGYFAVPGPTGSKPAVTIGVDGLFGINKQTTDPAKVEAGYKFLNWWLSKPVGAEVSNTIELSCIKDASTTNPMYQKIIAQSSVNGPTWFEPVPLTPLWTYSTEEIAKLFTGALSPAAFTQAAQSHIKTS